MSTKWIPILGLIGCLATATGVAGAEQPAKSVAKSDLIYGGEIMTPAEIADYNRRLSGDITSDEREKFLREHRERMDQRAEERGVKLKESVSEGEDGAAKGGGGGGGNVPSTGGAGTSGGGVGGVTGPGGVAP
jgi:hypothetical protein